jgi:hypothetical protein
MMEKIGLEVRGRNISGWERKSRKKEKKNLDRRKQHGGDQGNNKTRADKKKRNKKERTVKKSRCIRKSR